MREQDRTEEVTVYNERSLSTLDRAITLAEGNFALILVRCNYEVCKEQMWRRLQSIKDAPLKEIVLQASSDTLLTTILSALPGDQIGALNVFGLESVTAIDQVLISTNQLRDEFRKHLTFPLVLWVTDEVLQKLMRFAPDFKSWAVTSIKFELTTEQLLALWHRTADELFTGILRSNLGEFLPNRVLDLAPGCRRRQELDSALRDFRLRRINLDSALIATWQFILGRDAFSHDQIDIALEQYQQSLEIWQQQERAGEWHSDRVGERESRRVAQWHSGRSSLPQAGSRMGLQLSPPHPHTSLVLERRGVLLHHIGLCYCRQAKLQPKQSYSKWERAGESFDAAKQVFNAAGRLDLVAQLTIQLCEVLQYLQNWTQLQALALHLLLQPHTQTNSTQLARSYGFLATVAFGQSDWEEAKVLATSAVEILKLCPSPQPHYQSSYLLLLAKAQRQLGETDCAIEDLEQAIQVETSILNSLQQPQLYIEIFEELRSLYLERHQYLRAFELKQEQRSLEQQYGFSPFLGAAPLPPVTQTGRNSRNSTLEITAAGRQPDVRRLIERLSRNDHKLTIVHGSSGVGKSSLLNAGLVPTLKQRIIGARSAMPVVQKVYRDWLGELERLLSEALQVEEQLQVERSIQPSNLPYPWGTATANEFSCQVNRSLPQSLQSILEKLRLAADRNLLTILIFDQFEEFFFVCTNLEQRRHFYEFLAQCLNLPFVKVILSLREDYLHYLLECECYSNLSAINNNILDRQLRYSLGDLAPKDAKNVISTLAAVSQFQLEDSLIEALVHDLAGSSEVVRLIELQVVGAQLQAEKITTLAQYYELGADPKASLVERWLLNTVGDCGQENEELTWQVLFSLTDNKDTRPLKTQVELVSGSRDGVNPNPKHQSNKLTPKAIRRQALKTNERGLKTNDQLDLILKILVGSGLVFRVPEEPCDRYQLIHDYLVEPIRQHYKQRTQSNLVAQLEQTESELVQVRQQRLRALTVGVTMAVLAVSAGGLGWRAEIQRRRAAALYVNAQLSAISVSAEALYASDKKFDALIEGLRAARRLKDLETQNPASVEVEADTRLQLVAALSQAAYGVSERNRLEGHTDVVWSVSFSPDGQLIASASRDKTVKLWRPNGILVATLKGHEDSVSSTAFNPDGQLIASGSWDGTLRVWRRNGTPVRLFQGHMGRVYSVSFSPNGQLIASASSDRTIRLWTVDGKLIRTFLGHKAGVQGVTFSPDGKRIASASEDKTIRLWSLQGQLLQTLQGHENKVNQVAFSPDGQLIASASDDQTVKLWTGSGKLLQTFPTHDSWVLGVAFSPNGQIIASASADSQVRLWQFNGNLVKKFTGHSDRVTAVSFSPASRVGGQGSGVTSPSPLGKGALQGPDNGQLTTDTPILVSASYDKTIKLWEGRDQSRLILRGHRDKVRDVAFSPDSDRIATVGDDRTVKIWNRQGKLLNTLTGHGDRISSVTFSPDSQLLASSSRDGTVKLWSRSGALIETLRGHRDWVLHVNFSPDGERLASSSRDGTVKLWTRRGALIKTLTGHRNRVNVASFSPDGQLLSTASDDQTVKLWTAEGKLLKTLWGHSNWVLDVNFSPDSQLLASASYDNTVKLWSREGELKKSLKGHTDSVAHVRFSPSGKILATTSWDNRVHLWRLDDTLLKTLEGHTLRVTSVSWSNDGKALASASEDKTVVVWNLDLDALLNMGCNWLGDYLQNNPKVRQSDRALCQPEKLRTENWDFPNSQ